MKWLALSLLLALVPSWAVAQEPLVPSGGSSEISVSLIEIPVEVTRGGESVQGLTAADFVVRDIGRDNGRSLPIVAFEPVDLGGAAARPGTPAAPLPQAARRHVFLLFDFAASQRERLAEGVAASREVLKSGLDPRDLVAIGAYLPTGELPLLLNFTADRAAADRTLATLQAALTGKADSPAKGTGKEADPLRLTGIDPHSLRSRGLEDGRNLADEALGSLGAMDGTWGSFLQQNVLGHSSLLHRPNIEAVQRDRIMALADGMDWLAAYLRPVTGRKYLALFSRGFPMDLADGGLGSRDDPEYGGGIQVLTKLKDSLGGLKRSGWVIHAVDVSGVRSASLQTDGLFHLAHETGGVVIEGTNKLAQGLGSAMERSAHGYVLTIQVDDAGLDGAYHPLDIRLARSEGRVQIRSSGGYFAPLPFQQQKGDQRLAEAARLITGDEERDDLRVQVAAVPLRAGASTTPVAVLLEVPGAQLLASGAPRLGLEVYGYALDDTGSTSDFFARTVDLDRAKVGDRLAQGGVRVLGRLELPAGRHHLRVLVRDRGTGRLSLLSVPLSLPAAAGTQAASLDAFFLPAAKDSWVLVRPTTAVFGVQGRELLPAAQATLPAAGETQVLLLGRGFTDAGKWIKGRILTADGKPAAGGAVDLLTLSPGESGEPDLMVGRLRAGSLPAGGYLLELRLGGEKGTGQTVALRPFLVAGR